MGAVSLGFRDRRSWLEISICKRVWSDSCRRNAGEEMADPRVRMERDDETGIARITLDNPARRNAYDPEMRLQFREYLDELSVDDGVKVVLLRGEGGVFSTGADMGN